MQDSSLKDLVKKSRSYRRFDEGHEIQRGVLRELIEIVRFAPCARNQQALKYKLSFKSETNNQIFSTLGWAGYLKGWGGPKEGERPAAYVIVLGDTKLSKDFGCDHGIAAQTILLAAAEKALGGCIIGTINKEKLRRSFDIAEQYDILLVIALGKPAERIVLEDVKESGDIRYYRDEKDVHHVPKRSVDELIL